MAKVVVLKIGDGNFNRGYQVSLAIGEDGAYPFTEGKGKLPAAPELLESYNHWQSCYQENIGFRSLEKVPGVTNISTNEFALKAGQKLRYDVNKWLNSDDFSSIREKLYQKLSQSEEVRFIVQTDDVKLQKLPWHLWNFWQEYHQSEIALSLPASEQLTKVPPRHLTEKIKILAVFGDRNNFDNSSIKEIDTQKDWELLNTHLQDTELLRLDEPTLEELHEQIRQQKPNILFYAGHSSSDANGTTGCIDLNQQERIAISYLTPVLRKAVRDGLQLAIFNSCQGLGIARELADLHIPQIIVMREIVPDNVAQKFLQYFLEAYTRDGMSFYNSVREARENLSWLEYKCPGATWLPVIFQNPAHTPLTWREFCAANTNQAQKTSGITATDNTPNLILKPSPTPELSKSTKENKSIETISNFLGKCFKVVKTLSQRRIILMFKVIKQWLSNSQRQNCETLEIGATNKELLTKSNSNQTKSVLQNQLDSLDSEKKLSLWPPNGEYVGPVTIDRPLTIIDGQGATISALTGPVLSIESPGINLRNLRIEVTGCEDGTSSQDKCAILVKSGQSLQFHDVEVRGTVVGLPEEEGEWNYPSSIRLGKLAPDVEYSLKLRLIIPVTCRIVSDISGLQFEPHNLSPGANEIYLNIEKFPRNQDILIDGNIFLVSASLKRRIAITAYIRSRQDEESSISQNSIIWQPKDWQRFVNDLNSNSEAIQVEPLDAGSTPQLENNTEELPKQIDQAQNKIFIKEVRPNPKTFNSQPNHSSVNNKDTKFSSPPKNKLGGAFTTETEEEIP